MYDGTYSYTEPKESNFSDKMTLSVNLNDATAIYHSHPVDVISLAEIINQGQFSETDINSSDKYKLDIYLFAPVTETIRKYSPKDKKVTQIGGEGCGSK